MFPVQYKEKPFIPKIAFPSPLLDEAEEIQPIQGIMPDSKEEYWLSKALYKLGHRFIYQCSISQYP